MTPRCPCCRKPCIRETRFEEPAMPNPSGRRWFACPDAPTITTTYFRGKRPGVLVALTTCHLRGE